MKDIQRAISIEQEYVEYRLRGEQPYALVDKVIECGFSNLNEYFHDKREYELRQFDYEVVETTPDKGASMTVIGVHTGHPVIVFGDTESTYVFHGTEVYNEKYCKENGITVIDYHADGDNIVISAGDLSLGLCFPHKDVSTQYVLECLRDILLKYADNVTVDNNDIMIDGKKVAGSASFNSDKAIGIVIHFSFSDKSDLIEAICNETRKPVGYITSITREQLRMEVALWLQKR